MSDETVTLYPDGGPEDENMVGANGFEPSTSWSRTMKLNSINASSGVAYVIATTNMAEAFFQWTRQKRKQRPALCQTRTEQAAQEVFRMASRPKNTSYDRQPARS